MKILQILYDYAHLRQAIELQGVLLSAGYDAELVEKTEEDIYSYIPSVTPSNCQMLVSVNAFGFEKSAVDGGSFYNRTPVNTVAVLYDPIETYSPCLKQRINYTTSFLSLDINGSSYIEKNHPHIYHARSIKSIDAIPSYLNELDWRY